MMRLMRLSAYLAAALALSCPARAGSSAITFDTPAADAVAAGAGFFNAGQAVSSIAEAGFVYAADSGSLYLSGGTGHPGNDMEGDGAGGGGVLKIAAQDGGRFVLSSFDFAAFDSRAPGASGLTGTTTVTGLLGGRVVATDSYALSAGTFSGGPGSYTPYTGWTTERPQNLAGVAVDALLVTLSASNADLGSGGSYSSWSAIDNVLLVPEPRPLLGVAAAAAVLTAARRRSGKT